MADTPRISVLLPARDAGEFLGVALASIARQRGADWECVVVDDGSQDATAEIARRHARQDPRFRCLDARASGLVAALNLGLGACRGALVARMDADDVMHRDRLAEQAALLDRDATLAAAGCHVRIFPRATMSGGARAYERWLNGIDSPERLAAEAFVECPVAHPTLMIRRERLAALGGYRDRGWPEDYDLILRLLAAGDRVGMLPVRRLAWRDHPTRLSRTSPAYSLDAFTHCKAEFLARGFLAAAPCYTLWGHGPTARALERALAAHDKRPTHIVEVHPRRIGQRIGGVPVIAPAALPGIERRPIVVSVAGTEARRLIRTALAGMGFADGADFVCAA